MKAQTKHYVEYYYPGILFAETGVKEIPDREVANLKFPKNAYSFRFFDRKITIENEVKMESDRLNLSPLYFIGGQKMTLAEVKKAMPEQKILISNMEGSFPVIVKTRFNQCIRFEEGSLIINDDGGTR